MADYSDLKKVIEEIAGGVVKSHIFAKKVHATLVSVSPLQFQLTDKITIAESFLISPKYRIFREDEIGKSFVFQEDYDGQQYIYLYECAPQGENGVPYKWTGSLKCNLKGTCPDGDVVVTEGELIEVIHERGIG